jgi:hypothetical protein
MFDYPSGSHPDYDFHKKQEICQDIFTSCAENRMGLSAFTRAEEYDRLM